MKYLVDVGSTTLKLYTFHENILSLQFTHSYDLKSNFHPDQGLSDENADMLIRLFVELVKRFSLVNYNSKIFATGIFREIKGSAFDSLVERFYVCTGLLFNVINHDQEASYLEKAWVGRCSYSKPIMVINIGGRSTELAIIENGRSLEKHKLDIGVGTLLSQFPTVNNELSGIELNDLCAKITDWLPELKLNCQLAIYTGGELGYMKLAGYSLSDNSHFIDSNHPYAICYNAYASDNKKVFSSITMSELQALMPTNPNWMLGARVCSALAQSICKKYGVEIIIPSDTNLMDGVCVQEFRTVTICGSFQKNLGQIAQLIKVLRNNGIEVLSPANTDKICDNGDFVLFHGESVINNCTWPIERKHLLAIDRSDVVLVCNYNGYIGRSTSSEIGYAIAKRKKVIFLENTNVKDFDFPCEIGMLNY